MVTIAEKLEYLNGTKQAIKDAILSKGVAVSDMEAFRSYADKILDIKSGYSGPKLSGFILSCDDYDRFIEQRNEIGNYKLLFSNYTTYTITINIEPDDAVVNINTFLYQESSDTFYVRLDGNTISLLPSNSSHKAYLSIVASDPLGNIYEELVVLEPY